VSVRTLSPGLLTTVQDGGRAGHAAIGVGGAGAMDGVALRLANLLIGNAQNAAALEITLRGPRLRFESDALIALSGAEIEARCDEITVPAWRPALLRAGSELVLGGMRRGTRAYLAIAGGFDLPPALGSRSTDLNAGIGPIARPLAAGDVLPCSTAPRDLCRELWIALDAREPRASGGFAATNYSLDPAPWFDAHGDRVLRLIPGTHFDRLDAASQRALFEREFRIGVDSNRVGLRLEGAPLQLAQAHEAISESVAPGTLQLPPGGVPIVLAAEAPTTGGYPRIGHVAGIDQPHLAQRRPGDAVRFTPCDLAEAQMRYLERERAIVRLAQNMTERLHG
jgi:antagonist of KipI